MRAKIVDLFKTSRPISWINTAYPFAAGYLFVGRHVDWRLIVGTFFFLIPYNLLMYGINDVFDYESDLRNPRKGGVEGAVLDRSRHRLVLWSSVLFPLPFVVALLLTGPLSAKLFFIYLVFMVVAYSAPYLRFKERPLLDSFTSSTHFVSPLVYALLLLGWRPEFWPYVLAFFLWGMASHAFGAVQDVNADREGGIASVGTYFGARRTSQLAFCLYVASAALLVVQHNMAVLVAVPVLLYAASVAPYLSLPDKKAELANAGWRRFLWLNQLTGAVVTIVLLWAVH